MRTAMKLAGRKGETGINIRVWEYPGQFLGVICQPVFSLSTDCRFECAAPEERRWDENNPSIRPDMLARPANSGGRRVIAAERRLTSV